MSLGLSQNCSVWGQRRWKGQCPRATLQHTNGPEVHKWGSPLSTHSSSPFWVCTAVHVSTPYGEHWGHGNTPPGTRTGSLAQGSSPRTSLLHLLGSHPSLSAEQVLEEPWYPSPHEGTAPSGEISTRPLGTQPPFCSPASPSSAPSQRATAVGPVSLTMGFTASSSGGGSTCLAWNGSDGRNS